PGKYTFASSGTGATAHLFAELFLSMAAVQARHVPYKGSAPALTVVINGNVNFAVETVAATQAHIKSGKLKAYGVTTAKRTGAMPELAPIAGEIQKLLATDELKARLVTLGLDARSSTPEEMGEFIKREQERYGSIIKAQNIKVEQ